MRRRCTSRGQDELMLWQLEAIAVHGETATQVDGRLGISRDTVIGMMHRVRAADLAESGEPEAAVRAGYVRGGSDAAAGWRWCMP